MLFVVVAVLAFALIMLGNFAKKKYDFRMGRGIGDINREKWGLDEANKEYHD